MKPQKNLSMTNAAAKPNLNFSIENILKEEKPAKDAVSFEDVPSKETEGVQEGTPISAEKTVTSDLPWLAYTRYSPPKIPRSRNRKTVNRRKVSGSPRVPFSTEQLLQLEKSYEDTHYVTAAKVSQLSAMLKLPGNRIKIWFQNRRAREKKKSKKITRDGGRQTINDICVTTKACEEPQKKINQNIIHCPSRFTRPRYERIHPSFTPRIALDLQHSTCLNRYGLHSVSSLPQTHLSSCFECGLYKGLRYHA